MVRATGLKTEVQYFEQKVFNLNEQKLFKST